MSLAAVVKWTRPDKDPAGDFGLAGDVFDSKEFRAICGDRWFYPPKKRSQKNLTAATSKLLRDRSRWKLEEWLRGTMMYSQLMWAGEPPDASRASLLEFEVIERPRIEGARDFPSAVRIAFDNPMRVAGSGLPWSVLTESVREIASLTRGACQIFDTARGEDPRVREIPADERINCCYYIADLRSAVRELHREISPCRSWDDVLRSDPVALHRAVAPYGRDLAMVK